MASFMGAFLLTYLLSVSFTDEVKLELAPVQKLVDYQYNLNFNQLIPGKLYNGSIRAVWAVPNEAIAGIDGQSVTVKVTATAEQNSTVFFPTLTGAESKQAEAYLRCDVANGSCANTSVLYADVPVFASTPPDSASEAKISLKSEITDSAPQANYQVSTNSIIDTIKNVFSSNQSANNTTLAPEQSAPQAELFNFTGNESDNILDSLKPEGNGSDPVGFLRDNPLISLAALVIVIVITGAYLLNSRD